MSESDATVLFWALTYVVAWGSAPLVASRVFAQPEYRWIVLWAWGASWVGLFAAFVVLTVRRATAPDLRPARQLGDRGGVAVGLPKKDSGSRMRLATVALIAVAAIIVVVVIVTTEAGWTTFIAGAVAGTITFGVLWIARRTHGRGNRELG